MTNSNLPSWERLASTFELLEMVLSETPIDTVCAAKRVNRTFLETIENSAPLRKKLRVLREQVRLRDIIRRYAAVADAVNRREIERFTREVCARWDPGLRECRYRWRSDEDALAFYVYTLAIYGEGRDEDDGPLYPMSWPHETEQMRALMRHPTLDQLLDAIPSATSPPAPPSKLEDMLDKLSKRLQEQYDLSTKGACRKSIELPADLKHLMSQTDGIYGAGVPAETAYTVLVYHADKHHASRAELLRMSVWTDLEGFAALAGWMIGNCVEHRQVYYVLCHKIEGETAADASWRIFDRNDEYVEMYDNLAHFLEHETAFVEKRPGGAFQERIIVGDPILTMTAVSSLLANANSLGPGSNDME